MEDLLFVVTNACTLVTMNYIALKLRNIFFVQSHERVVIPLLTGLATCIMMLLPFPHRYLAGDLCYMPILMAGLRFGWRIAFLSTVVPALFIFAPGQDETVSCLIFQLLVSASVGALLHRPRYRSGYSPLMWQDGLRAVLIYSAIYATFGFSFVQVAFSDWILQNALLSLAAALSVIVLIAMYNSENHSWLVMRRLEFIANQDSLTQLPNVRSFFEVAEKISSHKKICVFMIDVDHFKNYNDKMGHLEGDQLLKEIAQLLQQAIGETDFIARYGGEEFIMMSPSTDPAELEALARRICEALSNHSFRHKEVQPLGFISASIGISAASADNENIEQLIAQADEAMYEVKRKGRNGFLFYRPRAKPMTHNA